jgi:dTMP kinase
VTARGRLLAFEGIDGSGKSTQARRVAAAIGALSTFEPGDTALGAALRAVALDPSVAATPLAEVLVMAADRAQHVSEVITPALEAGSDVVCDRFVGSTLAYQGYGRGVPLDAIRRVVDVATGGLEADVTILLDCPVDLARQRSGARRARPDRFEHADEGFLDRVRHGFLELAATSSGWCVVDASRPIAEVTVDVDAALARALP